MISYKTGASWSKGCGFELQQCQYVSSLSKTFYPNCLLQMDSCKIAVIQLCLLWAAMLLISSSWQLNELPKHHDFEEMTINLHHCVKFTELPVYHLQIGYFIPLVLQNWTLFQITSWNTVDLFKKLLKILSIGTSVLQLIPWNCVYVPSNNFVDTGAMSLDWLTDWLTDIQIWHLLIKLKYLHYKYLLYALWTILSAW